jgi:hypothetical protein
VQVKLQPSRYILYVNRLKRAAVSTAVAVQVLVRTAHVPLVVTLSRSVKAEPQASVAVATAKYWSDK